MIYDFCCRDASCCMVGSGRDRWTRILRYDWSARLRHRSPAASSSISATDVIGVLNDRPWQRESQPLRQRCRVLLARTGHRREPKHARPDWSRQRRLPSNRTRTWRNWCHISFCPSHFHYLIMRSWRQLINYLLYKGHSGDGRLSFSCINDGGNGILPLLLFAGVGWKRFCLHHQSVKTYISRPTICSSCYDAII